MAEEAGPGLIEIASIKLLNRIPVGAISLSKDFTSVLGLGGSVPKYDPNEDSPGSYDELNDQKSIGPSAFDFPNAEDVGSIIVHETAHEFQADKVADFTRLKHTNARHVLQYEAFSAELDAGSNPFRQGVSARYLQHVESSRADAYGAGNSTNKAVMDAGGSCATSFCSGD